MLVSTTRITTPWAMTMMVSPACRRQFLHDRYNSPTDVVVRLAAFVSVVEIAGDPSQLARRVHRPSVFPREAAQGTDSAFVEGRDRHGNNIAGPCDRQRGIDGPAHR